jgi:3-oxoacyl-[acyl-carrier-protein] synthase III
MNYGWDEVRTLKLVRQIVLRELRPGTSTPGDEQDLVETGLIDSMGWVAILSAIEEAAGIGDFGSLWPEGRPQSIRALVAALRASAGEGVEPTAGRGQSQHTETGRIAVSVTGWGFAVGSLQIRAQEVERECGLPPGTFRDGAGIESVCRAKSTEDELVLGGRAAETALGAANVAPEDVDFIVATSATFLAFPSLSASLHSVLLLPEACGAIDIGGACVGLIQALATAKALLSGSRHGVALVVASEVQARRLSSSKVPGEFRGLFGDGACAFVLARSDSGHNNASFEMGEFVWGCSGTSASLLRLSLHASEIEVQFKGEQLASAAVSALEHTLNRLEIVSGKSRSEVSYYALHEPNPRVVEILARRAKLSLAKIPVVSKTSGNLGSATCGVSLCTALSMTQASMASAARPLIFMAAMGPGVIWGGTYLH